MDPNDAVPDFATVEWLAEDIARGWLEIVHHSPEQEMDATCLGCVIPPGGPPGLALAPGILEIEGVYVNGEEAHGDVWGAIRACPAEYSSEIHGRIAGINVRLIFMLIRRAELECWCVFQRCGRERVYPESDNFFQIVQDWCSAVVRVGAALGASIVYVDGRHDPEPIVLWRRDTD